MDTINPNNLTMSSDQIAKLLPYLIMLGGGCLSLLAGVVKVSHDVRTNQKKRNALAFFTALITVVIAGFTLSDQWHAETMVLFNGMMKVDFFSTFFNAIFIGATALVILSSYPYLEKEDIHHAEYYSLVLFSCIGMMFLASSLDLIVLFVALETMSIAVYVLVGFRRTDIRSNEAALKYFILGGAVSAVLLYGIATVYGATASLNIDTIAQYVQQSTTVNSLFVLGVVLVVSGFLFKVALVPFHMWMPDVYEGAPTSVTNFMTTGLKAAAFAAFLRSFMSFSHTQDLMNVSNVALHDVLWVIAVVTMLIGNVIALTQKNIKRMLAYSSIAHSGYILIGFIAGKNSAQGYAPVVMYLATYVIANLGAFTVVSLFSEKGDSKTDVEDFAGVGFEKPWLGVAMTIFMFSMAGVPPTAGFAGKYLIFSSAVQAGEIWLAVLGVLCSAISAYYYLRVIVFMYMKEPSRKFHLGKNTLPAALVVVVTMIGTIQMGVFPASLIRAAIKAATVF